MLRTSGPGHSERPQCVEREDGEKDLWSLETSMPTAVARDSTEPPSQGPGASRTPGSPDERIGPCVPGLWQIRAFRFVEDALQFGRGREVLQAIDRDEASTTAAQRDAHEERCSREAEHERSDVGLPCDAEGPEEPEEVQEDVRLRGVHELERDPRPGRRRRASRGEKTEIEDHW